MGFDSHKENEFAVVVDDDDVGSLGYSFVMLRFIVFAVSTELITLKVFPQTTGVNA